MPTYAPPQRASPQVTTSDGVTRADVLSSKATISEDTPSLDTDQNSRAQSLLQVRAALDGSARIQSQLALQRALDGRAAAGGKAAAKKKPAGEKPALQMKGIAINDDAGLEREADVMGARATAMPANHMGAGVEIIQRNGPDTKSAPQGVKSAAPQVPSTTATTSTTEANAD